MRPRRMAAEIGRVEDEEERDRGASMRPRRMAAEIARLRTAAGVRPSSLQ